MKVDRIAKLETRARESHSLAWAAFFSRFRTALDSVPAGALEGPFQPVEVDEHLAGLEPELVLWEQWSEALLPKLEQAEQGDLSTWPGDLPCPPGDPHPLIAWLITEWRKHPSRSRSMAALLVLLALGAARWQGEGGDSHLKE